MIYQQSHLRRREHAEPIVVKPWQLQAASESVPILAPRTPALRPLLCSAGFRRLSRPWRARRREFRSGGELTDGELVTVMLTALYGPEPDALGMARGRRHARA